MSMAIHAIQIWPDLLPVFEDFFRALYKAFSDTKGREERYNKRVGLLRFKKLEKAGWFKNAKPGDVVILDLSGKNFVIHSTLEKARSLYIQEVSDLDRPHYIHYL